MRSIRLTAICLAIGFAAAGPVLAQQGATAPADGSQDRAAMPGMPAMKSMGKGSGMSGLTMDQQMAQCSAMREQMKQGKPMTAGMQKMMKDCDDMDRQMQAPMPSATKSR